MQKLKYHLYEQHKKVMKYKETNPDYNDVFDILFSIFTETGVFNEMNITKTPNIGHQGEPDDLTKCRQAYGDTY
jgi:hypothetical protein